MKDLKSIKIINAADLKNASNIKLAAANLLSQSKLHDLKVEARDYDYEHNGNNCGEKCSFIILVVAFILCIVLIGLVQKIRFKRVLKQKH